MLGIDGGFWPDLEKGYTFPIYGDFLAVARDYRDWKRSSYTQWPRPGTKHDQPWWVISNFDIMELLEEFFELYPKFGPKQVGANVPRAEQIFSAQAIQDAHRQEA